MPDAQQSSPGPEPGAARRSAIAQALVVALVLAAFGRTLSFGFIYDDYHFCRGYTLLEVAARFAGPWDAAGIESPFFRPLPVVSFALDAWVWGVRPAGFHLTNLLLHVAAALLVFHVARACAASILAAGVAAVLFATSPTSVTSAVWISARTDSLCAVFALASALAFVRHQRRPTMRASAAVCLGLALALLSKENAAVLPFLFLLADVVTRRGRPSRIHLATFAVLAAYLLAYALLPGVGVRGDHISVLADPRRACIGLGRAALTSVLPITPFVARGMLDTAAFRFVQTVPAAWLALSAAGAALMVVLGRLDRQQLGAAVLAVGWLAAMALPAVGLFDLRLLYLAYAGTALLLAVLNARRDLSRRPRDVTFILAASAVVCAQIQVSLWYQEVFRDSSTFAMGLDARVCGFWYDRLAPEQQRILGAKLARYGAWVDARIQELSRELGEAGDDAARRFELGCAYLAKARCAVRSDPGPWLRRARAEVDRARSRGLPPVMRDQVQPTLDEIEERLERLAGRRGPR